MRPLVLVLVLSALGAGAYADEGDLALRTYDISAMTAVRIPRIGPRLGSTPSGHQNPETELREPHQFLQPDQLVDVIREMVEPESWDEEGASIEARYSRLFIRNQVHVLTKVEKVLETLSQEASRRVRFEVSVWRMDWAEGLAELAGKEFVPPENAEHLESGSVETYPGVSTSFKVTRRHRILKDFDVEIAEKSAIADPIVEAADEGLVIDLVPHPTMDGGRVVVETLVRRGEFEQPIPQLTLAKSRDYLLGRLQLPVFRQSFAQTTAVVTSGGEYTVPFISDGKLIVVRVKTKVLGRASADWLIDTGALTGAQNRYMVGYNPDSEDEERARWAPRLYRTYTDDPFRPLGHPEELGELVISFVDPWHWEDYGRIDYGQNGLFFVRAKPEVNQRVHRFLAAREQEVIRPLRLDLSIVSVAGEVKSGPAESLPEAQPVRHAVSLTTLAGKETSVLLGRTRNFVVDYDVEVAQDSKIADPIIGQVFTGLAANLRPLLSLDGSKVRLDLSVLLSRQKAVTEEKTDPEAQFLGALEQVEEDRRVFATNLELPIGSLHVFDGGPDPKAPGRRLAIGVRVSAK